MNYKIGVNILSNFRKANWEFHLPIFERSVEKYIWLNNELLFRHTFETQIHIRNTDSENLHISLSNQWFSLIVIKVSQRVANDQIIDGKTSLQKSVILSIIRGVPPTSRQTQWNFQNIRAYDFWVTWPVPKILRNLHLHIFSVV